MRSESKYGTFATKIQIQQVEVFLSEEDLHCLLAGQTVSRVHKDKTSPAEFWISLSKEPKDEN